MSGYTVAGLWRYPVKSMAGEELAQVVLGRTGGVAGDREWALRDERRQEIADARKLPALLDLPVRYVGDDFADVEVTLPGEVRVRSTDPKADKIISDFLGTEVTLWRRPVDDPDHYRRVFLDDEDPIREAIELFQVDTVEEVMEIATGLLPPELIENHTMPGAYFDVAPLHLITDRSLATLRRHSPGSDAAVRRFRPNILVNVDGDDSGIGDSGNGGGAAGNGDLSDLPEAGWIGHRFRFGTAVLRVSGRTPRCVMTTHAVDGLPRDREIIRTIHRDLDHCLGVYVEVEEPGTARVGDLLEPLPG